MRIDYIRDKSKIINMTTMEVVQHKSINAAKRESRNLQKGDPAMGRSPKKVITMEAAKRHGWY